MALERDIEINSTSDQQATSSRNEATDKQPAKQIEEHASLFDLPIEILVHTFSFFDNRQLAQAGAICKPAYQISRDPSLKKQASVAWMAKPSGIIAYRQINIL